MHAHDRARGAYPHVISKSLTTNGLTSIYPQRDETGCSLVSPAAACQSFVAQRVPSNNRRRQQQCPTLIATHFASTLSTANTYNYIYTTHTT